MSKRSYFRTCRDCDAVVWCSINPDRSHNAGSKKPKLCDACRKKGRVRSIRKEGLKRKSPFNGPGLKLGNSVLIPHVIENAVNDAIAHVPSVHCDEPEPLFDARLVVCESELAHLCDALKPPEDGALNCIRGSLWDQMPQRRRNIRKMRRAIYKECVQRLPNELRGLL